MSGRRFKSLLPVTSALGAIALVAGSSGAVPESESGSELFDPAVIAAGVCGGSSQHASAFQPMQVALVSPAEAVADDSAARRCGKASAS
jgi:hypothetical protein